MKTHKWRWLLSLMLAAATASGAEIHKETGVTAGLAVVVGTTDGALEAELTSGGKVLVQGLALSDEAAAKARRHIFDQNLYGLAAGFANPPPSARPHTWWHKSSPAVTLEGITADLEAMKAVGVGGIQQFWGDYSSEVWRKETLHAIGEANRLGLSFGVHNAEGWSGTHGKWIKPEHLTLYLTYSQREVTGPAQFDDVLAKPTSRFYRDIGVLAYPTSATNAKTSLDEPNNGKAPLPLVERAQILDLSANLSPEGRLTWKVSPGRWTVVRIGCMSHSREVDKMSREALDTFFPGVLQPLIEEAQAKGYRSFDNLLIDSWEVGEHNWTLKFREEFHRRRGYDPLPWMVSILGPLDRTGFVPRVAAARNVESAEMTARFVWDYRRTMFDLLRENYFEHFRAFCGRYGLKLYAEHYGGPFDWHSCGETGCDVPMGEFWLNRTTEGAGGGGGGLKIAASAGHVMGRDLIAAEAFTDKSVNLDLSPFNYKALADSAFCEGINQLYFHTFPHQPWPGSDMQPGAMFHIYASAFNRNNTWWNPGAAFFQYLARCQYMLRQGRFVADLCYYAGEKNDRGKYRRPKRPVGYEFDHISRETLLHRLSVREGCLVAESGMTYRLLVLPEDDAMTPEVAEKLRDLVLAGAKVIGPRPKRSPSLKDYPKCDERVRRVADELWGPEDGQTASNRAETGQARILAQDSRIETMDAQLRKMGIGPDFRIIESASPRSKLPPRPGISVSNPLVAWTWIHRVAGDTDIYYISNQSALSESRDCVFRVRGKRPELWDPGAGRSEMAPIFEELADGIRVPLTLDPFGSVFVVFRRPVGEADYCTAIRGGGKSAVQLAGDESWRVGMEWSYERSRGPKGPVVVAAAARPSIEARVADNGVLHLMGWRGGNCEIATKSGKTITTALPAPPNPLPIEGSWELVFPPGWGAPEKVTLPNLVSWPEHELEGVRYFSGAATYAKEFDLGQEWEARVREAKGTAPGGRLRTFLDLGRVEVLAEVALNGRNLRTLWKPPFRIEVSEDLKPGRNRLEIKVVNLWPNRLIGDEKIMGLGPLLEANKGKFPTKEWLKSTGRHTYMTSPQYKTDDPLLASGLLGPVVLESAVEMEITK